MNRKGNLCAIECFNTINVDTATLGQFNAFLLNKSINFFQKPLSGSLFAHMCSYETSISTVYVALVLATGIVLLISSVLAANHKVTHAALWHGSSFYTGTAETFLSFFRYLSVILYLFSPALYLFKPCLLFCLFKQATCQATQQGCLHVSGVLSFLFLSQWGDLTPSCSHLCPLLMSSHVRLLTAEWTETRDTSVLTSEQQFWVMPFCCCLSQSQQTQSFRVFLRFLCKWHCLCRWVVVVLDGYECTGLSCRCQGVETR